MDGENLGIDPCADPTGTNVVVETGEVGAVGEKGMVVVASKISGHQLTPAGLESHHKGTQIWDLDGNNPNVLVLMP